VSAATTWVLRDAPEIAMSGVRQLPDAPELIANSWVAKSLDFLYGIAGRPVHTPVLRTAHR